MPIVIGARRESDFTDPIGMLGDCHRRVERFLDVLVRVAEQAHGEMLNEEQRGALDTALKTFHALCAPWIVTRSSCLGILLPGCSNAVDLSGLIL